MRLFAYRISFALHLYVITLTRILLFLSLMFFANALAQEKVTLSGNVIDAKSNETIIGVNIRALELNTGTITNEYGFFSLTLPAGNYNLQITSLGFRDINTTITLTESIRKNFSMTSNQEQLEEVVIDNNNLKTNTRAPEMSVNKLSIATIKKMPVVLGEVDVIKSILQLPGVTNAGEGASGFNVRGGGADQNLILLDEATIFNSSHVFGFFSVFNPDAIKDIKLYKGGIPARYGGRASSVLDIYQKDGNSKEYHINGGIGLISSRLLGEGPIVKNKGSFLVAGRTSYAHLFLKLTDNKNVAYFYDLNTKISYKIDPNNSVYLSGYFGRDVFSLDQQFKNTYGNTTLNFRWNHLFSEKLFSNLSIIYSDYYYGLDLDFIGFTYESGITNYNIKYDFKHYISDKFKLNYGINAIAYDFNPGTIKPIDEKSGINFDQLEKKKAFEPAIYLEGEEKLSDKIAISAGLRYSLFYRLGASKVNIYADQPINFNQEFQIYEKAKPIGYYQYDTNGIIANFDNLEPRAAIAYEFTKDQSVKASYNRLVQYLQLISNTSSPTPLDVYTPSDNFIKPQKMDQYAVGYFRNLKNDMYALEVESFYKTVNNRLDYIDGADLIANDAIEQIILNGQLRAYGLELLFRKNDGKITGWIAYTLSKSEQQTLGRTPLESGINNGEWYSSAYDKLHNIAVTASYDYSKKWNFGANFALQSGQPTTYPNAQYKYQGLTVPNFGNRNEDRLPAYHHLDIAVTYVPKPDSKKKWKSEWVFSIYNIYNRKNAASLSFRQNLQNGSNEAIKLSIFGVVPGISYNFKF